MCPNCFIPVSTLPCRFQRSRQGDYGEGDSLPLGLELVDLDGRPTSLNDLCSGTRPLVVLAGSYS